MEEAGVDVPKTFVVLGPQVTMVTTLLPRVMLLIKLFLTMKVCNKNSTVNDTTKYLLYLKITVHK